MLKYGEDLPKERHPPRRGDAFHGLPDLVVRRRRARRHTHRERPARQPPGHYLLLFGPHGTEADRPGLRIDAARVFYVIGRCPVMTDGGEVGGVARVVSPDHDHQVDRLGEDRKSTRLNSSHTVSSYAVF